MRGTGHPPASVPSLRGRRRRETAAVIRSPARTRGAAPMTIAVVHYINQFFAGIGGEDRADQPPVHRAGPVGPGVALATRLGDRGRVVGTVICGDNYFVEHQDVAIE